ncbi:hypothetical protein PDE_02464 [Penicillium oxalicum 114-2]|uniref:molybdopterin adenylyltransferase n=1 Tax=Penicillium oxalicum (strain 114-2 / CGMCC 5302) TaxID=933388 RepID=S7ZFT7_PENO1|nr:hypothetical protein PDE_02464 [Penicillium oxalicum 114-2]
MVLSYHEAIALLQKEAQAQKINRNGKEQIPLQSAINRISSDTICTPHSTPLWDTSAMDGYALSSKVTDQASSQDPIALPVMGLIAAGKDPIFTTPLSDQQPLFCLEIMTGARFPDSQLTTGVELDSCVKFEDVHRFQDPITGQSMIQVTRPVAYQQNRRVAGHDFPKGQVVIAAGEHIRPRHVMALASVGVHRVVVQKRLQIGLYSTGSELLSRSTDQQDDSQIEDVNGPYLAAALTDHTDAEVHFLGILDDHADMISNQITRDITETRYDLVITTGAVSAGRFDLIPTALETLQARILFHKLNIRPGHPVLAALVARESDENHSTRLPFFGLPGNPVASAACLRFLVLPFIRFLNAEDLEIPVKARLTGTDIDCDTLEKSDPFFKVIAGFTSPRGTSRYAVEIS